MGFNFHEEFNIANQLLLMATILPLNMRKPTNLDPTSDSIDTWEYGFLKSPIPSAVIDDSGKFKHVNEAFAHLVGFARSELENKQYSSLTHPDDIQGHQTMISRLTSGEQDHFTFQKRYITKFEHVVKVYLYVQVIDEAESPKLFFIHVLPIEVYNTLMSEGNISKPAPRVSKPFSKRFLLDQIEKNWITIVGVIFAVIMWLIGFIIDYNKVKWEINDLKNKSTPTQPISPPSKSEEPVQQKK